MALRKHFKVFSAFSFLRLRGAEIGWYQWIYPSIVCIAGHLMYYFGHKQLFIVEQRSVVESINGFVGILVAFYIAALAAVSSFRHESLDEIMKGDPPQLKNSRQGKTEIEKLTRRRFLAIIFGYCASTAIFLYVFGVIETHLVLTNSPGNELIVVGHWIKKAFWVFYTWALSSLLVVTLLGLHYLVDRMHRT